MGAKIGVLWHGSTLILDAREPAIPTLPHRSRTSLSPLALVTPQDHLHQALAIALVQAQLPISGEIHALRKLTVNAATTAIHVIGHGLITQVRIRAKQTVDASQATIKCSSNDN